MITQKGRVIYDRKKNYFKPKEISRILDSYSQGATGHDFGEFVWEVLDIMMKRQPRPKGFKIDFWEAVLSHELKVGEYDPEGLIMQLLNELMGGTLQKMPTKQVVPVIPETSIERKRRLIKERR